MAELNKIMIIGRLTKDPDLRYTPSGTAVCRLRMAVNHTYRVKDEKEKKQEVLFIDVSFFGRSAETVKQYTAKGRELFVEGRLQANDWTDKQGQKRHDVGIVADNFQFLGGGQGQSRGGAQNADAADDGGGAPEAFDGPSDGGGSRQESPQRGAPASQEKEDDLPF